MIYASLDIRPSSYSDLDTIVSWIHSPHELLTWAGNKFSYPIMINEFSDNLSDKSVVAFTVRNEKSIAGYGEINGIDRNKRSAFLCRIIVDKEQRQSGIGSAIIRFLLDYCKTDLKLKHLYLNVFTANNVAIELYRNQGFAFITNSEYVLESDGITNLGRRMYYELT